MLGAALGYADYELAELYDRILCNAVLTYRGGSARDLWIITKLKTGGETETSPIVREMVIDPVYWIYYALKEEANGITLQKLKNSFENPVFALCLGRSDELVRVARATIVPLTPLEGNEYFRNTILPFNFRDNFGGYESKTIKKGDTNELPQVFTAPSSFTFDKNRLRRPTDYRTLSAIFDLGVRTKQKVSGWKVIDHNFVLY